MTRSRKSSRKPCCASRASASPRSASSERSWNSSNKHGGDAVEHRIVEHQPGEDALGDDLDAGLPRDFRAEPHPQAHRFADALAERLGHALGGGARRQPARFEHQDAAGFIRSSSAQGSSASTSGTRVVLPAPGGATSTAALRARSAAVSSGSAASIGSGEENFMTSYRHSGARTKVREPGIHNQGGLRPLSPRRFCNGSGYGLRTAAFAASGMTVISYIKAHHARRTKVESPEGATHCRQAVGERRPRLSGRRLRLHFPRLSRAAADQPQIRRAAAQCRVRLLQHAVEAVARHESRRAADPSRGGVRQVGEDLPHRRCIPTTRRTGPIRPTICGRNSSSMREAVHAFDLPCLEQDGFEADDLIATYVREACEAGATATIVSSDKDLMQLVADGVIMFDTMKDKKIGRAEVIEKFGVPPEKVIDVQALIGDSTDNVPGVPGIGVKTAAQLIGEYGDLETLLARAPEIKQEKRRQSLIEYAEAARLSKKLVTLDDHVKLDVPIGDLAVHEPDHKTADRLPQGDGIQRADAARGGICQHRSGEIEAESRACRRKSRASACSRRWRGAKGRAGRGGARRRNCRSAGRRSRPIIVRKAKGEAPALSAAHAAGARRGARRSRAQRQIRPQQIPDRAHARPAQCLDRARARSRLCRHRHRDRERRSDAGGAVRLFARGRAERGLLRAAVAPARRRQRAAAACSAARSCADQIAEARGARRAKAAARRPRRA